MLTILKGFRIAGHRKSNLPRIIAQQPREPAGFRQTPPRPEWNSISTRWLLIVNGWRAKSSPASLPLDRRPSGDPEAWWLGRGLRNWWAGAIDYRRGSVFREFLSAGQPRALSGEAA